MDSKDGRLFGNNPIMNCFFAMIIISIVVSIISMIVTGGDALKYVTCNSDSDDLPDFIEVMIRSYQKNPYEQGSTYLPFTFLVFHLISIFIPGIEYVTIRSMSWTNPMFFNFAYVFCLFVAVCFSIMVTYIFENVKDKRNRYALLFLLFFSTASLWMFERGNILFIAVTFLFIFCFNYGSDSKRAHIVSLLALSIAATIKPYMAIYGILFLKRRDYSSIIICVAFTLIINIISILFFGGIGEIGTLLHNMVSLNDESSFVDGYKMDVTNLIYETVAIFGGDYHNFTTIATVIKYLIVIGLVIASFFEKSDWKTLVILALVYIMFSNISWIYLMLLTILPLIYVFREEGCPVMQSYSHESLYVLMITATMVPIPVGLLCLPIGINTVSCFYYIYSVIILILSLMMIYNSFLKDRVIRSDRKNDLSDANV